MANLIGITREIEAVRVRLSAFGDNPYKDSAHRAFLLVSPALQLR